MRSSLSSPRRFTYIIVAIFVFVSSLPLTVSAQRPIVVTADQPNIWTLEQAHYLLAQMHRRNLDLKAAALENLDANAINGISVDALKTLLAVSAEFDQAVGTNNRLLRDEKKFSAGRRRELIARRTKLQDESLNLTRQIAELKIKKLQAKTDEEKAPIQAQIDELTILQATVKEQIGETNEELKTITTTGTFESLDLETPATSSSGTYNSMFQETAKKVIEQFNNSPKLNASLRLDNYLQMQYEILSKQLTLLRDEVGPGERLIFMEIPQSINASYDRANDKWAQSWWKIAGYSQCIIYKSSAGDAVPCSKVLQKLDRFEVQQRLATSVISETVRHFDPVKELMNYNKSLLLTTDDIRPDYLVESQFAVAKRVPSDEFSRALTQHFSAETRKWIEAYDATPPQLANEEQRAAIREDVVRVLNLFIKREILPDFKFVPPRHRRYDSERDKPSVVKLQNVLPPESEIFRRLYLEEVYPWVKPLEQFAQDVVNLGIRGGSGTIWEGADNRSVRVVDLFPRQSSLNINDLKLRSSTLTFKSIFQLISGFGAAGNYQREREQYSQFVQQELYSSAFGKGGREFGWTFNPMPGTRRLLSGVRTTYAIVIVPEDATSLIMQSKGCYFPRSSAQPSSFDDSSWMNGASETSSSCYPDKKFIVPIPDGGVKNDNFGVTEVNYEPVKKGGRAVVSIYGHNLSSQIGVLVNGVPLTQSLGLGQPFIRDDSTAGAATKTEFSSSKVRGSFERVGINQLVAAFEMDETYEGVPTITLVAPGMAQDLNRLDIRVNGRFKASYMSSGREWPYIFGTKVGSKEKEVSVDKIGIFHNDGLLDIVVTGKNLVLVKTVYVNGIAMANENFKEPSAAGEGRAATPTLFDSDAPAPYDPESFKKHLISLKGLPPFKSEKTIQVTLLTPDGALSPVPVENPAFKKDAPSQDAAKFTFDETKLTLSVEPKLRRCYEEGPDKVIHAIFELGGIGFTGQTKGFVLDKEKEQEQDLIYESATRVVLTLVNPKPRQLVVVKDPESKLKTQRVVVWTKPEAGCK